MEQKAYTGSDLKDYVAKYIKLRDKRDEIKRRHTEELRPYQDMLGKMENVFLGVLNEQGAKNITTEEGTILRKRTSSVKVEDFDATLDFIRKNEAWEALEKRISKTFVEDYMESHGEGVPGVRVTHTEVAQVRRS